jgi:CubicO group peptidase (beta-lactamase class C family)
MRQSLFAGMAIMLGSFCLSASAADPPIVATGKTDPRLISFDRLVLAFLQENDVPGAQLAVAKNGRVRYSRGFGFADRDKKETVQPTSLFRIASISKSITAVAVMRLVEQGKIKLDDKVFEVLKLEQPKSVNFDERWKQVTIRHLLQHTGGWDKEKSFDPLNHSWQIVKELNSKQPVTPSEIVRYMLGKPLQFDPGSEYHYGNFGYCLLGRVIEKVSGLSYEEYVQRNVLAPLDIRRMRLGKTLLKDRDENEVRYYMANDVQEPAVMGPEIGKPIAVQYGALSLESYDSCGDWLASAEDLVRFADAFENPRKCKILNEKSIREMFGRPAGAPGENKDKFGDFYYACGWFVRPYEGGKMTTWHIGSLPGSSTELVRRYDGMTWAILFNSRDTRAKTVPHELIEAKLFEAADDAMKRLPR